MRRTITLLCAFTIMSAIATTAAQAATIRRYDGTTSQDKRLVYILRKDDGAFSLKVVDVKRFVLTCDDNTTQIWGVTWFGAGAASRSTDATSICTRTTARAPSRSKADSGRNTRREP